MDFTQLTTLLEQAQVEQGEMEQANAVLATKRGDLAAAQEIVVGAQAAVTEAAAAAGAEKTDLIAVLQQMQSVIAELLASLQA